MTATIPKIERAPVERTEHPHVVKSEGTLGGKPRIEGTRISVGHVFVLHSDNNQSAAEIAATYSLPVSQVHDALSYAYDHPDEMTTFNEQQQLRSVLRRHNMVFAGGRLILAEHLDTVTLSPGTPVYTWETLPAEFDQ